MNKTFAILTHRLSLSLEFTVQYLSSFHNNEVIIHVDKKSNMKDFEHLESDRVTFIKERENVKWGHISVVHATIKMLRQSNANNFFFLISGDDFPLMTNDEIDQTLAYNKNKSFIHFQDGRNNFVDPILRVKYIYPSIYFKKNKKNHEKMLCKLSNVFLKRKNTVAINYLSHNSITLYKGTQWFTFEPDAKAKIINFLNLNPCFIKVFEHSFCPDEIFFHTIVKHLKCQIYHDEYKINDCLRFIDWKSGPDFPKNLTIDDFPRLTKSGCFFARKASDSISTTDFLLLLDRD
ncbi:beta-1,6-N-acetylglucosaminyltransferase [Klebsiella pneumoniae]|uniref:beta-1,6-N-acetylglucosaminyltransferase n=1 Tax=Klebsiella pneumoniae TaxID=573 RepID=UPI0027D25314|nr:beta-1,6-N-acetylglucosaminyltransferase [Klebsiella pneumoniae]